LTATLRRGIRGGAVIFLCGVVAAGLAGGWGQGVDLRRQGVDLEAALPRENTFYIQGVNLEAALPRFEIVLPSFEKGELPNTLLFLKADMVCRMCSLYHSCQHLALFEGGYVGGV
jgi:hypothetical protein